MITLPLEIKSKLVGVVARHGCQCNSVLISYKQTVQSAKAAADMRLTALKTFETRAKNVLVLLAVQIEVRSELFLSPLLLLLLL